MKKTLFIVLAAVLCGQAAAQQPLVRNGDWWSKLPTQEVKWGYLVGFFDGLTLGHRMSWMPLQASEKTSDCVPHIMDAFRVQVRQYLRQLDNQKLASELDTFYLDPKNKSIKVADAVWIVVNKLSGKPAADLDAMIQDYRR